MTQKLVFRHHFGYNTLKIIILCAAFYGIERFCYKQTDGFRLSHLFTQDLPVAEEKPIPQEMLQRPFTYLAKGGQFYAFLSEDRRYVLKFFKNHHLKPQALQKLITSCHIAEHDLKEESALVYLHLNKTPKKNLQFTLIDKLNIAHKIEASSTAFLIQRYADPVTTHIANLMKKGKNQEAQQALESLFQLIRKFKEKNIIDRDPNVFTNFGFLEEKPVCIDIGDFSYSNQLKGLDKLSSWIEAHYPDLKL